MPAIPGSPNTLFGNNVLNGTNLAGVPYPIPQLYPNAEVVMDDLVEPETPQAAQAIAQFLDSLGTPTKSVMKKAVIRDHDSPLQEVYNYRGLSIRKTESVSYEKSNKVEDKPFVFVTNHALVGIEIEVENMHNSMPPFQAYWAAKADGSLRNAGIELVSVPLQVKQIQLAMEHAWKCMYTNNKPDFSNRTSIHVHLNCRDMSQNQIYVMCLLYAIFEKHFYAFAGQRRLNSIFCVPLYRTNILSSLKDVIYGLTPTWHKYTGLNLLPLLDNHGQRGFGTIEFRHLYGTHELQKIYSWINQILCLRKAAMSMTVTEIETEIFQMNTTSSYMDLYHRVFGDNCLLNDKNDFEECISNLKREIFTNEYSKTLKKSDNCVYWEVARKLAIRG